MKHFAPDIDSAQTVSSASEAQSQRHIEPEPREQPDFNSAGHINLKELETYTKVMRRVLRVLKYARKVFDQEHRAKLKTKMLSCRHWRERVLRELGGETALQKWEIRFRRAQKRKQVPVSAAEQRLQEMKYKARFKPKTKAGFQGWCGRSTHPLTFYDRVKVDAAGQFCLARIKSHKPPREAPPKEPYVNPYGLKVNYTDIKPIPLYPHELRGNVEDSHPANAARGTDLEPAGNMPTDPVPGSRTTWPKTEIACVAKTNDEKDRPPP